MRGPRMIYARSKIGYLGAVLAAGLFFLTSAANAQPQSRQQAEFACRPDVFRLCQQFIPNEGPITQCLRRNVRNLSAECRTVFAGKGKKAKRKKIRRSRRG